MTRRSTRSIINLQGTAIAIAGLVVGIPLGIFVGRLGWHLIANRVPLRYVQPLALVATIVVVPAALVLVNSSHSRPAGAPPRLQPAQVLHTE